MNHHLRLTISQFSPREGPGQSVYEVRMGGYLVGQDAPVRVSRFLNRTALANFLQNEIHLGPALQEQVWRNLNAHGSASLRNADVPLEKALRLALLENSG
jgi:hexokinase